MSHGEAVSIGMVASMGISLNRGLLSRDDYSRAIALISGMGLPAYFSSKARLLRETIEKDKKRAGHVIPFVLLDQIGKAVVEEIEITDLEAELSDLRKCR